MTIHPPADEHEPSASSTSRSLLAGARRADPAAWERLAGLYAPLVAFWCRRWGIADQDIPDILQEVFSSVSRHLDRFHKERPADTFRGWLLTIARNKARDHYRRRGQEPVAIGGTEATRRMQQVLDGHASDDAAASGAAADPDDGAVFNEVLLLALESIRGEFHERTWQAFWKVVVEGRAAADVAADLDMRPGTVRVAKSRVLLRLRHELGDFGTTPSPSPPAD